MSHPEPFAFFHENAGYLRIAGADRFTFIQRQTTNDVASLPPDRAVFTVLTTPAARIIDVLQVFAEDENTLGVITLPGRGADTAFFLKRRVFFMDKVTITDESAEMLVVDIEGTGVSEALARQGIPAPGKGVIAAGSVSGFNFRAVGQTGPGGQSVRIIASKDAEEALRSMCETAGIPTIDAAAYDRARTFAGLPGPAAELTEDYTPLETGLDSMISATKGCYTGQEVIARQITYDKITRSLVGIVLEAPVAAGSKVFVGEQSVGTVTSFAENDDAGQRALAVIKRPHFEPGTSVIVETGNDRVRGVVASIPFS